MQTDGMMPDSPRQWLYLTLAVAGVLLTWYHNIQFGLDHGNDLAAFIEMAMVNHASSSLTLDVSIAALTFVLWMWSEAGRLAMPHRWLWIVLTFCIAVAFAFPLFLMVRERYLNHLGRSHGSGRREVQRL